MGFSAITAPSSLCLTSGSRSSSYRKPVRSIHSSWRSRYGDLLNWGLSCKGGGFPLQRDQNNFLNLSASCSAIVAQNDNPPIMPAVATPAGPVDLPSVLLRNRIIFIGQPVNSVVAQRVISQLVTLAAIDENADILMYLNCPGGNIYSIMAIYDCMSWIKPRVGTVGFGLVASQGALLLAGGEKGMRYAMPNTRIMIHQPQAVIGGPVVEVRSQVKEALSSRNRIDKMYVAFTGQPLELVQHYTDSDRFMSVPEAIDFGLVDAALETEY